jgi:hypothetical protein
MKESLWGLLGVVLGGLLVSAKEFLFDFVRRRRNERYLAMRAVCLLDAFVEGCIGVVHDDGTVQGQPADADGTHRPQAMNPTFPIDQVVGDWQTMKSEHMYELLGFPNLINVADRCVSAVGENDCPPDFQEYFEERQLQYARLGIRAHEIALALRKRNRIPPRSDQEDRYGVGFLRERRVRIESARAQRQPMPFPIS